MSAATFRVFSDYFAEAEVILKVDFDVLTVELATEINNFWSGADRRLRAEDGSVIRAVIRMFGQVAIGHFMANGGASFGPDNDSYQTQRVISATGEGWPDVNGLGILITAAEVAAVDFDDVSLESA